MAQTFRIASWNVNSLRLRLPQVLQWLAENPADVLCLQETKVEDALFPHAAIAAAGWHLACHGQKSYNGVAILARTPLSAVTHGFTVQPAVAEGQARVIGATVMAGGRPLRLLNLYLPQGEAVESPKFGFKERMYGAVQAEVLGLLLNHERLVVCGDFNIAADARDIPVPEKKAEKQVMFTPAERQWLHGLLGATGLSDALRLVSAEAGIYSWFDYRMYARAPHHGWRIDYHMISPALQNAVRAVHHHTAVRAWPQPSDHVPVVVELEI